MIEQALSIREAITSRRSIKNFNGQPVDRESLLQVLDDAKWAPNHGNREPWRVVMACGKELDALYELLKEFGVAKWRELSEEDLAKQMKKFVTPGGYAFIIVKEDVRQKERLEDFAAASCYSQNVQLLAWDAGIGSCWKTPPFIDNPKFRDALGVENGERIIGMLQFGYFDELPKAKPRREVDQFVTRFGQTEE
ncbi:nitroreductase family protein [Paenisporosarcina cavernae]|uniref:Putative NAD(P)H nitroreductase n=1 Tax=Paenisporosarcina cavernae TaxID=2320858 RepID=A0A385YXV7_9BACL|nr:nitroreductase [Paenisporosarcina cavernae]AYC30747.1 nitroreductase [Paenisporosarcina cavernae]